MTRAASPVGSKQRPWGARKVEPEAWNHPEVRGPDHMILNPRLGASVTREVALGWAGATCKAFGKTNSALLGSCVTLCDLNPRGLSFLLMIIT